MCEKFKSELWAEKEMVLAGQTCDKEEDWDCDTNCYIAALAAFKCLLKDGCAGGRITRTNQILKRLIAGKPLTAIYDDEDIWDMTCCNESNEYTSYQCNRMSSLFKHVYNDGRIEYYSNSLFDAINIDNHLSTSYNEIIREVMHEKFPIKLPYYPLTEPIIVYFEEFLTDISDGDYDTFGILYALRTIIDTPTEINRFFKKTKNEDERWVEIGKEEYEERKSNRIILK